ncbi:band 4.1-like protein 4A [Xenia sp. Carnegie-2017]|uniref:band 4.1-like protein 4A n=1 Tax=Xenia sp. Carnegie-2017 TaxID=2897299 RepID=UPI001F037D3A|nr:band 4.1-like protein 4A [Xenia sp. Carnegie-2017]
MSCFGGDNKVIICHVVLLDETEIAVEIKAHTKGRELLDQIFNRINLYERDYFGLRFMDHCEEARWLDPEKSIIKQNRNVSVFYLSVRFYSSDPCKLQEEITRYLFFQQLKRDILQSRLHCSFTVATRLFSYILQAELGDFDPKRHTLGYASEFRFLPNQSEKWRNRLRKSTRL